MFDKIWDSHLVDDSTDGGLIYVDRHLVHEVTSPQAFEGLRTAGRRVRRPDCTLVTVDHNVPTTDRSAFESVQTFIKEAESRTQVLALEENARDFDLTYYAMDDKRQGIVHIIGPEQVAIRDCSTAPAMHARMHFVLNDGHACSSLRAMFEHRIGN
jgi:3-isopropylmalate dehydratase